MPPPRERGDVHVPAAFALPEDTPHPVMLRQVTRGSAACATWRLSRGLKTCVVGSGPSGFYTTKYLLKASPSSTVDMVEALPTPFGLVRYARACIRASPR